jgi:hypothetical protein
MSGRLHGRAVLSGIQGANDILEHLKLKNLTLLKRSHKQSTNKLAHTLGGDTYRYFNGTVFHFVIERD